MKKIIILFTGLIIILYACVFDVIPHTIINLNLNNKTSYQVDFFSRQLAGAAEDGDGNITAIIPAESDYQTHGSIDPGITEIFERNSGYNYSLYCTAGSLRWEKEVYIDYDQNYEWIIYDPEPIPKGEIKINNNSIYNSDIYINGILQQEILIAGNSITYTKQIGNYNLLAKPDIIIGNWQKNIELTESGYIWNLETITEYYPSRDCYVWNFENNALNHFGIDDWDLYNNIFYSTEQQKFGNYSFFAIPDSKASLITLSVNIISGSSQSGGTWVYPATINSNTGYTIFNIVASEAVINAIFFGIHKNNTGIRAFIHVMKKSNGIIIGNINTTIYSNYIDTYKWHYIAFSYDSNTNTIYLICDNTITFVVPAGIWEPGTMELAIYSYNNNTVIYTDEIIFIPNRFIDPAIFVNHYINNVQWGKEYIP